MTTAATRRWWVLSGIGIAVGALHLAALLGLGPGWIDPDEPAVGMHAQRFELRNVDGPRHDPARQRPPAPVIAGAPLAVSRAAAPDAARVGGDTRAPAKAEAVAVQTDKGAGAPADGEQAIEATGQILAGAATVAEVPVYATRLPPAGQWRYRLQRGLVTGEAELLWAPRGGGQYELSLTGRVAGMTMLEWASQGQLDAAGVAPERLAIRRRGRDRQAVNFQREAGKITFSGPTHELALVPGVQDRLSWMVQLSAVLAAAPDQYGAGSSVALFVAGARGDADIWTFVVQGVESLDERPTLKLVREPRRRYDTRAEVWLDPADHFLPLRLVQTPSGGGAALELHRERDLR